MVGIIGGTTLFGWSIADPAFQYIGVNYQYIYLIGLFLVGCGFYLVLILFQHSDELHQKRNAIRLFQVIIDLKPSQHFLAIKLILYPSMVLLILCHLLFDEWVFALYMFSASLLSVTLINRWRILYRGNQLVLNFKAGIRITLLFGFLVGFAHLFRLFF